MSVDKVEGILLSQGEALSKTTKIHSKSPGLKLFVKKYVLFVASEVSCLVNEKLIKME